MSRETVVTVLQRLDKGIFSIADARKVDPVAAFGFREAFETSWGNDAHFACYVAVDPKGEHSAPYFRLNKTHGLLEEIRAQGGDILCWGFALDWDTPGHVEWTLPVWEDYIGLLAKLHQEGHWLATRFAAAYKTKNGLRLVYRYPDWIPADAHEGYVRAAVAAAHAVGLRCDALDDWTRLMRLPKVVREGSGAPSDPFLSFHHDRTIDLAVLPPDAAKVAKVSMGQNAPITIQKVTAGQPTPEQAEDLLRIHTGKKGQPKQTEFLKEAKRRLAGRECFPFIFEERTFQQGSRDQEITRLVGEAISMLVPTGPGVLQIVPGTCPESVYALFLDAVMKLDPDKDTQDWTKMLWSIVCRLWAHDKAVYDQEQTVKAERAVVVEQIAKTVKQSALEGARKWHPSLPIADDEAWKALSTMLVAARKGAYYLMRADGRYCSEHVPRELVRTMVEHSPFAPFFELFKDNGEATRVDQVLAGRTIRVRAIQKVPQIDGGYLKFQKEGPPTLYLRSFARRTDLTPTYSPLVDEWLKLLSHIHYKKLCKWIGRALAFDEGAICALSIVGCNALGKGMFARGFAECLEVPLLALGVDLVDQFNGNMARTPFLHVDENLPKGKGAYHVADIFRTMQSGTAFSSRVMHTMPEETVNPIRAIFTANNTNAIQALTKGRGKLTDYDLEALATRIFHFHASPLAKKYLADRGGRTFTDGWIAGDDGVSNYVLAKHYLWLYEQHKNDPREGDGRFLVEGSLNGEVTRLLHEASDDLPDTLPEVSNLLAEMLDTSAVMLDGSTGLYVGPEGIFVTPSALYKFWSNKRVRSRVDISTATIAKALEVLCETPEKDSTGHIKAKRMNGHLQRWSALKGRGVEIILKMKELSLSTERVLSCMEGVKTS